VKLLLDTHTLLWFVLGDAQLSAAARQFIEDPANTKFVSPATYWEIAIKISIGKYALLLLPLGACAPPARAADCHNHRNALLSSILSASVPSCEKAPAYPSLQAIAF
jgi:hypothetical protein